MTSSPPVPPGAPDPVPDQEGAGAGLSSSPGSEPATEIGAVDITDLGAPGLRPALEAVLLVADEPLDAVTLASITRRPTPEVVAELSALQAAYTAEGRGFTLAEVAGGWRFYTREECAGVVERFVRDGQQARLTQAALETLAIVAYRQPVTRARIAAIRGVNVDGVVRTLVNRGLIEESGAEEESGAYLYRTTGYFLERLGLNSLDDLPPLADYIPDIETIEAIIDQPSRTA